MEKAITGMIFGLVAIVIGVSLIPVVFTALSGANWTLAIGGSSYDLAWVGYLIGLTFAISLIGVGVGLMIKGFKNK